MLTLPRGFRPASAKFNSSASFASALKFKVNPDPFREASARLPPNSILQRFCFRAKFQNNSKLLPTPSACLPRNSNPRWLCFRKNLTNLRNSPAGRSGRVGKLGFRLPRSFRIASASLPQWVCQNNIEKQIIPMTRERPPDAA